MAISVSDLRLSFVWACPILLDTPPNTPGGFVRRADYEKLFGTLQPGARDGFSLPWPAAHPYAHKFWVRYLNIHNPATLDGSAGWLKAVPFRVTARVAEVPSPWSPGRLSLEMFVYPFALGFIATFAGSDASGTKTWMARAIAAATQAMSVTFAPEAAKDFVLPALAGECLTRAGNRHFATSSLPVALTDPFVIATVVRGAGVNAANRPAHASAAHRFLYGAATLRKNWNEASLEKLQPGKTLLEIRSGAAPGDVVYAAKRGRTIWFPSSFTDTGNSVNSLSCYHRNQVFGALQVESLCGLAQVIGTRLKQGAPVSPRIDELGRIAASQLSGLYRGDADTYRSISLKRQIDDLNVRSNIDTLVKRYGLPAI